LVAVQRAGDRLAPHAAVAHVVAMPRLDVSSSLIRARIAAGEAIDFLTPPDVVAYIHARGLYRTA
jgi:nicotinic acid mononucleotide adenylyltransferase